jgi:hypothetical protein
VVSWAPSVQEEQLLLEVKQSLNSAGSPFAYAPEHVAILSLLNSVVYCHFSKHELIDVVRGSTGNARTRSMSR